MLDAVARQTGIQGELQEHIMRALWKIERGSVEEVRSALPKNARGAYTTVQTVLNRLAKRKLVDRERVGNVIFYSPRLAEGEFFARSVDEVLSSASKDARRVALANLVGDLDPGELDEIRRLASDIERKRDTK